MSSPPAVTPDPPPARSWRRFVGPAAILAVGALALYGVLIPAGKDEALCPGSLARAAAITPFAKGEVAAVTPRPRPVKLPPLTFTDGEGKPRTLADFSGRTVLLNLWATWCGPCKEEMPALDKLQAELGASDFEVVTVNIDTRNLDRPRAFLDNVGVKRLAYYADPSGKIFQDLKSIGKAVGMPTTLLVDPSGCELANIGGPAEWASQDALKLIRATLGR